MNGGTSLRKRAAATLALTGAALAFAVPAHAVGEAISVTPSTVDAGASITVDGSGWTCAADVDLFVDGALVDSIPFAEIAGGAWTRTVTAPNTVGDYTIMAEYGLDQTSTGCDGSASDPFTVVTTSTTSSTTTTTTTTTAPSTSSTTTTSVLPETSSTTTSVDVEGPTTTTGGSGGVVSTLPVTGSSSTATMVPLAILVLGTGVVLLAVSRRRSNV